MLKVFQSCARLFVAVGWLLFVASIPICVLIGTGAAFNAFYFPTDPSASLDAFDAQACKFVLASGAFAAAASSIALALKFRVTASMLVVAIWSAVILGTQGTRSFVQPGPEYFERHAGEQAFLVPWQYVPAAPGRSTEERPHQIGFFAMLCLSDLKGEYEQGCQKAQQLHIFANEQRFHDTDIALWRQFGSQMNYEQERHGYRSYTSGDTFPLGVSMHDARYFVRVDSTGQLTRLVVCKSNSEVLCSHHALAGDYWLKYDAPLAEGDMLDRKLAALVESWRSR